MAQIMDSMWGYLKSGGLLVAGAVIGWFANQWMDYRTAYKEALNENYEQFSTATADVENSLKIFGDVVKGAQKKKDEDVTQLQTRLLHAVTAVNDLERRLGKDSDVIASYKKAAVVLKHASDAVSGPADGKPLVDAVNDYLVAESNVRDQVIKEHNAFISGSVF